MLKIGDRAKFTKEAIEQLRIGGVERDGIFEVIDIEDRPGSNRLVTYIFNGEIEYCDEYWLEKVHNFNIGFEF